MRRTMPVLFLVVTWASAHPSLGSAQEKQAQAKAKDPIEELERKVLYAPRKYKDSDLEQFKKRGGVRVEYTTKQGAQSAWLIPSSKGEKAEKLWIVCGGNAALALDLEPFCRALPFKSDAFLLVDYPGYGACAGSPSPESIRENMKESVRAAARHTSIDPEKSPGRVCVFGHSLGCAAALIAVEEHGARAAVLCAPFTSTQDMAQKKFGLSANLPFRHVFDNRVGLKALAKGEGKAWVFHGDKDEVIPVDMSKTLAQEFKGTVTLKVVAGGRHNDVLTRAQKDLVQAMSDARK